MKKSNILLISVYTLFILFSLFAGYNPGKEIGMNLLRFAVSMLKVLPAAFILIGLFEVWVKKETIEKHLGTKSGFRAYLWVILLAGTSVGGMYVALPVSASLYRKGARLTIVLAYLTASAVFRIPMAIFETTFLGIKFTLLRFAVSLPLIVISSEILGRLFNNPDATSNIYTND